MVTRTSDELAKRVLQNLRVLDALETPRAEDNALVKERYADVYEWLVDEDLAFWPENQIPGGAMDGLTRLVADVCAEAFDKPNDGSRRVVGIQRLTEFAQIRDDGEATEAEYF